MNRNGFIFLKKIKKFQEMIDVRQLAKNLKTVVVLYKKIIIKVINSKVNPAI